MHRGVALLLLLVPATVRADEPAGWVGQVVFPKAEGTPVRDQDGKEIAVWRVTAGRVVREGPDNVVVRHTQHPGPSWGTVRKADVVRSADAVSYYTDRLAAGADMLALRNRAAARSLAGDPAGAERDLSDAIRRAPVPALYNDRGLIRAGRGDHRAAVADFTEALRLDPTSVLDLNARANSRDALGDLDGAVADFDAALRIDPGFAAALCNRGSTLRIRGEFGRAIRDQTEALRLDPGNPSFLNSRGLSWNSQGEYEKAIADFTDAIRNDPAALSAFHNRAAARLARGEYGRATADFEQAVRLDPKAPAPAAGLAWLLATCPDAKHRDGKRAVALATRACELSGGKNPRHLGVLAAAHAEAGDFGMAVEVERRALADPGYVRTFGEEVRELLRLYERGRPYREPPPE